MSTKDNTLQNENETGRDCSNDNVEAFKLDEEFDYDNVTLTPKYSAAQMTLLADIVKQNIIPVKVPFAASSLQVNSLCVSLSMFGVWLWHQGRQWTSLYVYM